MSPGPYWNCDFTPGPVLCQNKRGVIGLRRWVREKQKHKAFLVCFFFCFAKSQAKSDTYTQKETKKQKIAPPLCVCARARARKGISLFLRFFVSFPTYPIERKREKPKQKKKQARNSRAKPFLFWVNPLKNNKKGGFSNGQG